jgi:hypothetical protein
MFFFEKEEPKNFCIEGLVPRLRQEKQTDMDDWASELAA